MAKKVPVDTQELRTVILRQVDGMRNDKKHCDFLIKVGSEEIPVHRAIICATSDYFDAMFSHPTRENESGVVEMIGVDPECAMICVDHMYGKEVSISPEKYEPLMYVANLMQLHTLRDAITTLLEANLDPKSFFNARRIASMYECKKLEEKCNKFAEDNFALISKEEQFGEVDKSYVKKMIKSKNVKIPEDEKLDVILKWIKHDSDRNKVLVELMDLVVLPEISVGFRRHLAENEPLISENFRMYKLFSASVFDSMQIVPENIPSESRKFPSTTEPGEGAIAIFDRISGHLQRWNPMNNTWKQMQAMNDEMRQKYFSAVSLSTHIYVLMENKYVYRLEYCDATSTWEKLPDMIENHGKVPPATVLSGCIYVLGGHGGHRFQTAAVEKYVPHLNQWQKLDNLPVPSNASAVLGYEGCVYTFGGFNYNTSSRKVRKFDPLSSTWTELATMREARSYSDCTAMDGKIYLLGNSPQNTAGGIFDVEANRWKTMKCMKVARGWLRVFSLGGFIYAVGGYNSSPDSIEKYDAERNEWKMVEIPRGFTLNIMESVEIEHTD